MPNILDRARFGVGISPVDGNGTTTNGAAFDTASLGGISDILCIVQIGNIAANSTALKIQHSDDMSAWADLSGYSWSAPTATDDGTIHVAFLRRDGSVQRYLRVVFIAGAGASLVSSVWVGLPAQSPSSDSERGVAQSIGAS